VKLEMESWLFRPKKKGFNLVINNPKKNWCLKVLIWCLSKKMVAFVAKFCTKLKKRKKSE
jgi:hypothetical protein